MYRANYQRAEVAEEESAVDLTPMLDVVFIMLIFFIVTATFLKESGIHINRPDANTTEQKDDTTVVIAIAADNSIWVDKRRIDVRSVRANIERLHAENPSGGVVIQADELASVKTFTAVLDAARSVVAHEKIALSTTRN